MKKAEDAQPPVAIGLVHYPVNDRAGDIVATNITNFDIHDIARAARVYNIEKYFIIHPSREQLMFVSRVLDHWRTGAGSRLNPMRRTALGPVQPVESLQQAIDQWGQPDCEIIATSAQERPELPERSFREQREAQAKCPTLLLFGTGFGLGDDILAQCHAVLEPIRGVGPEDYRHLSVRSAVSICLDRVLGSW